MRMLGTYKLKFPIELVTKSPEDGAERTEELKPEGFCVTLRRPKGKDLLVFDNHGDNGIAAVRAMLIRIANLDQIEIDNLDGEDWVELGNLLERFAPNGRKAGATSSEA